MLNVSGGGTSCTPPPLPKKNKNESDLWSFFSCILELGQPGRAKLEGGAKCTHLSEHRWQWAVPPVDHGNNPVVGPWSGQGSAEHLRACVCLCVSAWLRTHEYQRDRGSAASHARSLPSVFPVHPPRRSLMSLSRRRRLAPADSLPFMWVVSEPTRSRFHYSHQCHTFTSWWRLLFNPE